jgi:hypothetical protein
MFVDRLHDRQSTNLVLNLFSHANTYISDLSTRRQTTENVAVTSLTHLRCVGTRVRQAAGHGVAGTSFAFHTAVPPRALPQRHCTAANRTRARHCTVQSLTMHDRSLTTATRCPSWRHVAARRAQRLSSSRTPPTTDERRRTLQQQMRTRITQSRIVFHHSLASLISRPCTHVFARTHSLTDPHIWRRRCQGAAAAARGGAEGAD